jgi:glycosyltransferase involved in cell wall biosynthesis
MNKPGVALIIPNNNPATHMGYVLTMFNALRDTFSVEIFVEKPHTADKKNEKNLVHGRLGTTKLPMPLRGLALLWWCFKQRVHGTKIFYVHYLFIGIYAAWIVTRLLGGRVLYWNCGLPWQYKRPALREFFEQRAYRLIDTLVTGSSSLIPGYSTYYKLPASKIAIVPNWIDLDQVKHFRAEHTDAAAVRHELGLPLNKKIVLFVHKVARRKGAHFLPEIAASLPDDAILVVLGDGPMRAEIEQTISNALPTGSQQKFSPQKSSALPSRHIFAGFVPHALVQKYLLVADLFIMPSEEEGFPHSLLEAMAFDVPFVAFGVGGVAGMTPSNEAPYVIEPNNINLFIQKMHARLAAMHAPHIDAADTAHDISYSTFVEQFNKQPVMKKFSEVLLDM